jgi:MerR family transcriptional regulator, light-induced transcriptional regulator
LSLDLGPAGALPDVDDFFRRVRVGFELKLPNPPFDAAVVRTLSTSEFAKALGVSDSSIRRLADAGELEIHRTRGGHRRIPVSEAIRYIRDTRALVHKPELLGLEVAPQRVSPETADASLRTALEDGHAAAVIGAMQWLYASGMGIAEICDGPIASAMHHIGSRWPHDKRAIFVEHRATMLCARAISQLRLSIPEPDEDAPKAIGAAASGDMYLLPTLIASLVLHDAGFNEINLGPNTPLDVLADSVVDEQPDLIWLSIAEPFRSRSQVAELIKLAEIAKQNETRFIVGGRHAGDLEPVAAALPEPPSWTVCDSMTQLRRLALKRSGPLAETPLPSAESRTD